MTNVNNITNQIKAHGDNSAIGKSSGAGKSNNGSAQVNGIDDFLGLVMQNIQPIAKTPEVENSKLKEKIQELLQQSPEALTELLKQGEGAEDSSPLITLLNEVNLKPEDIGLNIEQLPPSLIGKATAIQAQLQQETILPDAPKSQETLHSLPKQNNEAKNATIGNKPVLPQVAKENILQRTDTSNIAPDILLHNNSNEEVKTATTTPLTGQTSTESQILSFNAGDVLKSFLPDETGRKPRSSQNNIAVASNSTKKPLIDSSQSQTSSKGNGQQQSKSKSNSSPNIATQVIASTPALDNAIPITSSSSFITSVISADITAESVINQTNNPDITSNALAQGKSIASQNFSAQVASKGGTFQSPTTQKIYMNMQRNAAAKVEQMTLQLEPMEMGRIEINMKFGKDGMMKAHLVIENKDTLALLQRDSNALENALKDAGIELDESALSFDMASRDDHFDKTKEQNDNNQEFLLNMMMNEETEIHIANAALAAKINANQNGYIRNDSVNILI